jgi:hypothetical protein
MRIVSLSQVIGVVLKWNISGMLGEGKNSVMCRGAGWIEKKLILDVQNLSGFDYTVRYRVVTDNYCVVES